MIKRMKKFLAIAPYFGGVSSMYKGANRDRREGDLNNVSLYFEKTYKSIEPYMTKLIVAVTNDDDYDAVEPFARYPDQRVEIMKITGIDPIFLPANMARIIQQWDITEEYIYFTESDQMFYAQDVDNLFKTIDENHNTYIVPQRFEQIPPESYRLRKLSFPSTTDDRFVEFDGELKENNNKYVVANEPVIVDVDVAGREIEGIEKIYDYDDCFYVNPAPTIDAIDAPEYFQAYGGSWLCHRDLFKRIEFTDSKLKVNKDGKVGIINFQPTETTAGHDLLRTADSMCLKSKDLFYFHVDHLSGYEFNKKL